MNFDKYAVKYKGQLSDAAIKTFIEINQSITDSKGAHPLDKCNPYMREALLECFNQATNKAQFVKLVKAKVKLTSSGIKDDPACQYLISKFD